MKKAILVLTLSLSVIVLYAQKLVQDEVDEFTGKQIKRTDAKYVAKGKKYKIYWSLITVDGEFSIAVYLPYAVGGTIDAEMYIKFKDGTIEQFDSEDLSINYGDASPKPWINNWSSAMGQVSIPWGVDVYSLDKEVINKILIKKIDKIRVVMGDKVEDGVVSDNQQMKINKMIQLVYSSKK